jgi:hypothetical protein
MTIPPAFEQSDLKDKIHEVRCRVIIYFLEGRWSRTIDFGGTTTKG